MNASSNNPSSQVTRAPETFTIRASEVEGRLDPFFYRGFFQNLVQTLIDNQYGTKLLKELVIESSSGDWGEKPNTEIDPAKTSQYTLCPVIRNTNFDNNHNLDLTKVAHRLIHNAKIAKKALSKNDILIEKSGGSPEQPVGRVAIIRNLPEDEPVLFSNFLQKICVHEQLISPDYLFNFLKALYANGYTQYLQNQTTGIKNLRLKDFLKLPIPLPPLEIQQQIADEAESRRTKAKELEEEATNLLASIDDYVLGELGIELPEETVKHPETFTIRASEVEGRLDPFFHRKIHSQLIKQIASSKYPTLHIRDILSAVRGVTYSRDQEVQPNRSGNMILRSNNVSLSTNRLDTSDIKYIDKNIRIDPSKQLKKDDILMSAASGSKEHVGKVSIIEKDLQNTYHGSFMLVLRSKAPKQYAPRFLFEILAGSLFRGLLARITGGTNINNLNFSMFQNFLIPLPSLEIQQKIANEAESRRTKAKELQEEATDLLASIDDYVLGELGIELPEEAK